MSFSGYGPLLLSGTWMTIQLALLSLLLSVIIGLIGASSKLSKTVFNFNPNIITVTL